MAKDCKGCIWWVLKSGKVGTCRARPPERDESGKGVWPETQETDWCSAHAPKVAAPS